MQRQPNIRSGNTPGIDYGASDVYRTNVPENLQVKTIGATQLGVGNLNVTGTFSYSNINASAIVQTDQIQEFNVGAGIQVANNMYLVGNLTVFKFPVFDTSGVTTTGFASLGSYDTVLDSTMDFKNSTNGGFAFYNSNGLIASLTKPAANQGTVTTDFVVPTDFTRGVGLNSPVIGDNNTTIPGALRYRAGVLQYCDSSATYQTLTVGTTYTAGANIGIAGGVISLNNNISLNQVTATTVLPNTLSFANTVNASINLAQTNTFINSSTAVAGPNIQVDGTGKMTVTPQATGLQCGGSLFYPTYTLSNAIVLGSAAPTVPGGVRFISGKVQFCDNTSTWQDVIANNWPTAVTFAGLNISYNSSSVYGLQVTNNANAALVNLGSLLAPSMPLAGKTEIVLGRSTTTNNSATLDFNYNAAGGATNSLGLGVYNNTNLLTVSAGSVGITPTAILSNGITVNGASGVNINTNTVINGGTFSDTCNTSGNGFTFSNAYPTFSGFPLQIASFLMPNINPGQATQFSFGKDTATGYNSVVFNYNYVGSNDPTSSFGIGMFGHYNLVTMSGNLLTSYIPLTVNDVFTATAALNANAGITVQNPANLTTTQVATFMTPNISAGNRSEIAFGHDQSTNDCGLIDFNYNAAGGATNSLGLGVYGTPNILTVSTGGISLTQATTVTGGLTVSTGNIGVTAGNLTLTSGNIVSLNGDITLTGSDIVNGIVAFTNTANAAVLPQMTMLAPNLLAGNKSEVIHGVATTANNSGLIDFNYVALGSASNSLGFGVYGTPNVLTIQAGAINFNQPVNITSVPFNILGSSTSAIATCTNTISQSVIPINSHLGPNAVGGQRIESYMGQALSANNSGLIDFNFVGAGSTSNSFGFGVYGSPNLLTIKSGAIAMSVAAQATSTLTVSGGAAGVPSLTISKSNGSHLADFFLPNTLSFSTPYINIGVQESIRDCATVGSVFAGVGSTNNAALFRLRDSTTMTVYDDRCIFNINATTGGNAALLMTQTNADANVHCLSLQNSAGTAGQTMDISIGYDPFTANNAGYITYTFNSLGSATNLLGIGLSGKTDTLTMNGNGLVTATYGLASRSTASGTPALALSNITVASTVSQANMLAPNIVGGQKTEIALGQALSANNSGLIDFNYVGAGSTSNNLGLGLYGNPNILTIDGTNTVTVTNGVLKSSTNNNTAPPLQVFNTFAGSSTMAYLIASGMTNGTNVNLLYGQAGTVNNSAVIQFNYTSSGSAANSLGFGLFGNSNLLTLDTTGLLSLSGSSKSTINSASTPPLQVWNNFAGSNNIAYMISPFMTAASRTTMLLGQAGTANNAASISYFFNSSGATSNYLGLGLFGNQDILTVTTTGITATNIAPGTAAIQAYNNVSSQHADVAQFYSPNIVGGQRTEMRVGKTSSVNDTAVFDFNFSATGSTSNSLGIGFYGANSLMNVYPTGNVSTTGAFQANNYGALSGTSMIFAASTSTDGSDYYFYNNTGNGTALQISPFNGLNSIYIKPSVNGKAMNFQSWISGTPTNTIIVDTGGSKADYFQVGTNKRNVSGGIAMSGTDLQFNDGSVWQTVNKYLTYSCQIQISNSGGTMSYNIFGTSKQLGGTYSIVGAGDNSSCTITLPGNVNTNYSFNYCITNRTAGIALGFTTLGTASTNQLTLSAFVNASNVGWLSAVPSSGDQVVIVVTVIT